MRHGNGGPAFPRSAQPIANDGMSLRDYFAAQALQRTLSGSSWTVAVSQAYAIADLMLAERKPKQVEPVQVTDLRPESERGSHVYVPQVQP
jgi:hypothetical protein